MTRSYGKRLGKWDLHRIYLELGSLPGTFVRNSCWTYLPPSSSSQLFVALTFRYRLAHSLNCGKGTSFTLYIQQHSLFFCFFFFVFLFTLKNLASQPKLSTRTYFPIATLLPLLVSYIISIRARTWPVFSYFQTNCWETKETSVYSIKKSQYSKLSKNLNTDNLMNRVSMWSMETIMSIIPEENEGVWYVTWRVLASRGTAEAACCAAVADDVGVTVEGVPATSDTNHLMLYNVHARKDEKSTGGRRSLYN